MTSLYLASSLLLGHALDNGLARTPPMGWLSWERWPCEQTTAELMKTTADKLVELGLAELGYEYVNIDDCWAEKERGSDGNMVPHHERFPDGIKAVADYVHAKGLKLGLYTDIGTLTCGGYPGLNILPDSKITPDAQFVKDIKLFASWAIDSLKVDGCNAEPAPMNVTYPILSKVLNGTGRPILYSCSWPAYTHPNMPLQFDLMGEYCNLWRNYDDIWDSYSSITSIYHYWGDTSRKDYLDFANAGGPGRWNDPDMLMIGNTGLSKTESQIQMAMWAIVAAPLFMSNDLSMIEDWQLEILKNKEAIRINQDPLGKQGQCVDGCEHNNQKSENYDSQQVWMRQLGNGDVAVLLFNAGIFGGEVNVTATCDQMSEFSGLGANKARFCSGSSHTYLDVFTGETGNFVDKLSATLKTSSILFTRVSTKHGRVE